MNDVKHLKHLDLAARVAKLGFWLRDVRADTVAFSDELCEMLGLPKETVINLAGDEPTLLLGKEIADELRRLGQEALDGGRALDVIIPYRGRRLHLINWVEWEDGVPVRVYGVAQDITGSPA
jgi:PAS domain-containing protein